MLISESVLKMSCDDVRVAAGEYLDYRDRNRSFAETAAYQNDEFNLTGAGAPLRVNATPEPRSRNNQMMVLEILWYQTIRRAVGLLAPCSKNVPLRGEYTLGRGEEQASVARMACTPLFAHGVLAG